MKDPVVLRASSKSSLVRRTILILLPLLMASVLSAADTGGRKMLHDRVPAIVAGLRPAGRLPMDTNLSLAIGLPLRDKPGLTNFLAALYDPVSPSYQRYLSSEEFTERFGPTEKDYQDVINFTERNGLKVVATHPNRLVLDVTGPVSSIEKAFQITLQVYPHPAE